VTERDQALTTSDIAGSDAAVGDRRQPTAEPTEAPPAPPPAAAEASSPGSAGHVAGSDSASRTASVAESGGATGDESLLGESDAAEYRGRWEAVQIGFVDEPRASVEKADVLVASVMQQLARRFAEERERLEQQWRSGEDVGTEELRMALQRYRSFFERLLDR
jgi:hypothetical protein